MTETKRSCTRLTRYRNGKGRQRRELDTAQQGKIDIAPAGVAEESRAAAAISEECWTAKAPAGKTYMEGVVLWLSRENA